MNIAFSPPDISELEINEIVATLKSGWITTGPKTKLFEQKIAQYCGTDKAVCLNSATAAMEMTLHMLGIGPGDEVITSAYTYTASASVIHHTGAKIVLVDTALDSYEMDYNLIVLSLYANGSSRATAIGVFNPGMAPKTMPTTVPANISSRTSGVRIDAAADRNSCICIPP